MKISGSYMVVRMKSMNRMKAVRRITALIMLALIIFCFAVTGFDMGVIIRRGNQAVLFIKRMFPPDTAYCGKIIERVHLSVLCLDFLLHFYMRTILLRNLM